MSFGGESRVTTERDRYVRVNDQVFPLDERNPLVFGRVDADDVVGLDPLDTGISRQAGRIVWHGSWLLENLSANRPLLVEYPYVVRRHVLSPGASTRLAGPAVVLVSGRALTHALEVWIPREPVPVGHSTVATTHASTDADPLHESDHLVLVAIAEGYLRRWPRHDPNPRSYEQAANRLGTSPAALRRRIERLRDRLAHDGVFVAAGSHALRDLVEFYIDTGRLNVVDLSVLDEATSRLP